MKQKEMLKGSLDFVWVFFYFFSVRLFVLFASDRFNCVLAGGETERERENVLQLKANVICCCCSLASWFIFFFFLFFLVVVFVFVVCLINGSLVKLLSLLSHSVYLKCLQPDADAVAVADIVVVVD